MPNNPTSLANLQALRSVIQNASNAADINAAVTTCQADITALGGSATLLSDTIAYCLARESANFALNAAIDFTGLDEYTALGVAKPPTTETVDN